MLVKHISEPGHFWLAQLALLPAQGDAILLQPVQHCQQPLVVLLAHSVYADIILDLHHPLEPMQHLAQLSVALCRGCMCPHHESVEPEEAKGGGELEQVFGVVRQLELMEGVVQIDDSVSITAQELVSQLFRSGDGEVCHVHVLLHGAGVDVEPYGVLIPLLLGEDYIVYPASGMLRLQWALQDTFLHELVQLLLEWLHQMYGNGSLLLCNWPGSLLHVNLDGRELDLPDATEHVLELVQDGIHVPVYLCLDLSPGYLSYCWGLLLDHRDVGHCHLVGLAPLGSDGEDPQGDCVSLSQ